MRWVLPGPSDVNIKILSSILHLHPLAARVLIARGHGTPESANVFLADKLADLPDPMSMKGLRQAAKRICAAIQLGEQITLYGDYDVDGVCSTALLYLFLRELGARVSTYIPHRIGEGYGLNLQAIERLAGTGTRVLVTLDCGISSAAEVARANELGLEVVIVDHHTVPETLPPALAVINPHQPGCEYPTRHLCAAGVAFNLCLGIRQQLRAEGAFGPRPGCPEVARKEPNLRSMLDLVALATVADVVPLTGANRILVKHGLEEIAAARRPGIRALKEIAGLGESAPVSAGQVGFRLAPRINAAGRLHDASLGLRLLCAETVEEARPFAQALDAANLERQGIEHDILSDALRQAETLAPAKGFVLCSEAWHPGVIGIVASRIVERFHRPTVMVALKDGVGRGSARSIEGFHMVDALQECASHLLKFGGHRQAAGLAMEGDRLPAFRQAFEAIAKLKLSEDDVLPRCRVDAVVSLGELSSEAAKGLEALGPFGSGNPEPVFASRRLSARPRLLRNKREGQDSHLKLFFDSAPHLDAIGFGMGSKMALSEGPLDLAFQLSLEEWNGRQKLSLKLKDVLASR